MKTTTTAILMALGLGTAVLTAYAEQDNDAPRRKAEAREGDRPKGDSPELRREKAEREDGEVKERLERVRRDDAGQRERREIAERREEGGRRTLRRDAMGERDDVRVERAPVRELRRERVRDRVQGRMENYCPHCGRPMPGADVGVNRGPGAGLGPMRGEGGAGLGPQAGPRGRDGMGPQLRGPKGPPERGVAPGRGGRWVEDEPRPLRRGDRE